MLEKIVEICRKWFGTKHVSVVENVVVDKDNETVKILDTNSNMVYIRKDEKVYTLTGSTIE